MEGIDDDVALSPPVNFTVKSMKEVQFPPRVAASGDAFTAEDVDLQPYGCDGFGEKAGRQPRALSELARGVWKGTVRRARSKFDAAACIAPLLEGTVRLDSRGVLVSGDAPPGSFRFSAASAGREDDADSDAAANVLGSRANAFNLVSELGHILSHDVRLWLKLTGEKDKTTFEVLLVLKPRQRPARQTGPKELRVAQKGPLGDTTEVWEEVPTVEMPSLLRLMMHGDTAGTVVAPRTGGQYLVEEEEEILVVNCWRRRESDGIQSSLATSIDSLHVEQLLWYDTLAALAETAPCAETAVPMARVCLVDEGLATSAEIEECMGTGGRPADALAGEDASRVGSLTFLLQYASPDLLRAEILPRLLPEKGGSVRVFSAALTDASTSGPTTGSSKPRAPRPQSIDDLFNDDADFRTPNPWASAGLDADDVGDPLAQHELTSVFLVGEKAGFAFGFHCLQAMDPCE